VLPKTMEFERGDLDFRVTHTRSRCGSCLPDLVFKHTIRDYVAYLPL
jgi:hypothetical protein